MWLPEAHVEAPTAGSILLAGVLLKLGGYGFIFFLIPFFSFLKFLPLIYTLTTLSMIYSSFILFRETHLKKIIAYSSIIHMNIAVLGLFSDNLSSISGGIFMMFSHGFISSGLFFSAGIIFNRFKTYDITIIKNLSQTMPKFSLFFIILIFSNIGLPLTSGFIGEFLILLGTFNQNFVLTIVILFILLLNTIYNMLLLTKILYGNFFNLTTKLTNLMITNTIIYKPIRRVSTSIYDISRLESVSLFLLCFFSIFFGIFPQFFLTSIQIDYFICCNY
jgi:NADH-quinone oxidoreductase subunit M